MNGSICPQLVFEILHCCSQAVELAGKTILVRMSNPTRHHDKRTPLPISKRPLDHLHTPTNRLKMSSRSPSPEFCPLAIGEEITPLPTYKTASTTTINFSNLLCPPLQLHEDLKSGCGGQLWPAGMVLAQQMLRYHRNNLKHARMWV